MDTKNPNPKDVCASGRLDMSLFPPVAVAAGALAMTEGALKYGPYNWRDSAVKATVYYSAMRRHLDKWFEGQWQDPVTHVPHLASVLANAAILLDSHASQTLIDDLPKAMLNDAALGRMYEGPKLQHVLSRPWEKETS